MLITLFALASAAPFNPVTDDHAIIDHLTTVESDLRSADVSHLSSAQQSRRAGLLDVLSSYKHAGVIPHNQVSSEGRSHAVPVVGGFPDAPGRASVFVDGHGSHCAVGYLMAADGQDALVEDIVEGGNLRFIQEIDDARLVAWADSAGFSVHELERIQPSYDFEDNDGDGWNGESDCNDNDASINPDAEEICDEIDNNCDGTVDEGCQGAELPVEDFDGDGYGTDVDCNDEDALIHPDAEEVCDDLVDNDCDGLVDENCGGQDPVDIDGDGYSAGEDCDDDDATVNPGAAEVCEDGIDNDCDGVDLTCLPGPTDEPSAGCSSTGGLALAGLFALPMFLRRRRN